ncbi:hypothetical protein G3O06_07135 [Burkholderia sp. Ac-20345]|uniref:hypothetical protein n=1 Tax=Burkholderia sp. Ac-20345 TaxID=2703891 RepID=UPI00197B462A|nr:hypothetical protein [Burkholderia sp. Ac-20345]MBN3777332.1 hypothetical protein [Burkholderia sp. Ac-20345]
MGSQRSNLAPTEPLHVAAAALLQLAGETARASATPAWGRKHALELLDTLLSLSSAHGFAQQDLLREKLITGACTRRTRLLAEVAFENVPSSALLDAIRRSGFHFSG